MSFSTVTEVFTVECLIWPLLVVIPLESLTVFNLLWIRTAVIPNQSSNFSEVDATTGDWPILEMNLASPLRDHHFRAAG